MYLEGFLSVITDPEMYLVILLGVAVGIVFGAITGLTATMAITMCLPMTYAMETKTAVCVLMALYIGRISGGLISAILLNIPGTPSSLATTFDGAPMAASGHAKKSPWCRRVLFLYRHDGRPCDPDGCRATVIQDRY